ncbi:hypothetical protein QFC21_004299 [Naganishia friedmannii]|uniref:Uncharacterized protein n=1 Tax=Naganishia friedmannii TaxID=89922 RepID=A0ACC2VJ67_9TREE|nr:hypothetical protein QFC21_004299 [Naganishia friedmannii]
MSSRDHHRGERRETTDRDRSYDDERERRHREDRDSRGGSDRRRHDEGHQRSRGRDDRYDDRSRGDRNEKERDRSPYRERERNRDEEKRRGAPDDDRDRKRHRSSRSSDSGSEAESKEERERRRRKREKKEKRRKEEKRAKKEKKLEKKEKKKLKKTSAVTSQWGTYGIIDASEYVSMLKPAFIFSAQPNKEPEFRAWLVEERHINPETLVKDKERKEFLRFVEDFNTATLPHEKYYDMEKYEIKMRLIRGGEAVPDMAGSSTYDPNADLAAHSNSLKRAPVETDSFLNKAQVEELRRVQSERSEVAQRKVLGMSVSKNMGVRHEEKNKLYR